MLHKILGWLIGITIMFIGIVFVVSETLLGLLVIAMGISFIPLFRNWLRRKTRRNISTKSRQLVYSVFTVILVAVFFSTIISNKTTSDKEFKEKREKERLASIKIKAERTKSRANEFKIKKDAVLDRINEFKKNKEYSKAMVAINYYLSTKDKDLLALKKEIETSQRAIHKTARTKTILAKLKKLPASKINDNYNLYQELAKLHPDNKKYIKKLKNYGDKAAEAEAKKAIEKIFYGDKPIQSSWDGSYRVVETYLKRAMNDPSSLDMNNCTSVYKIDNEGWGVRCSYRGKNAFGGMVLNSNWFIIRQNTVVDIKSSDAYSASY